MSDDEERSVEDVEEEDVTDLSDVWSFFKYWTN